MLELLTIPCYFLIFLALLRLFLKKELGWIAGPVCSATVVAVIFVAVELSHNWMVTGSLSLAPPEQARPALRLSFVFIALVVCAPSALYLTFRKKPDPHAGHTPIHKESEYREFLERVGHFTYPDWQRINEHIESNFTEEEFNKEYTKAARAWVSRIKDELGYDTPLFETTNFLIVAPFHKAEATRAARFYEQSLSDILKHLEGVAVDDGFGKHVVFIMTNDDDYYAYISPFHSDGDNPMSGGICIRSSGYTHFVVPISRYDDGRHTVVHELTHCCTTHLPLPTWIDEALAMRMESALVSPQYLDLEEGIFDKHQRFWNKETIQQFWSGKSWDSSGDSNTLSYHLAQILWRKIEKEIEVPSQAILDFAAAAHFDDAGEGACQKHLGLSLSDLVEDFLGEGNWTPQPDTWPSLPDTIPDLPEEVILESEVV